MVLQDTYRNIEEIGSGGGGTVYKAYHIRMEKNVVLKKIHDGIAGNGADIRRELNILKNLRHSYLPTVLDFIEDSGSVYTVMDYIEGESFEDLMQKGVHFTQMQIVKYAKQLGEVLVYLHGQNPPIVHGDIKPANIMLTPRGDICLIDFNISQLKNGAIDLTMGYTPGYAAPEQIRLMEELEKRMEVHGLAAGAFESKTPMAGVTMLLSEHQSNVTIPMDHAGNNIEMQLSAGRESEEKDVLSVSFTGQMIDERADIYSAGATLYALLLGHAPGESDISAGADSGKLKCSEGLAHLIDRCMAYQPEKRFQSGSEYLKAVLGIGKMDKRYRHMALRQELAAILCMFGIAACVFFIFTGREWIEKERRESYGHLMTRLEECREAGAEQTDFDDIYNEAVAMFPEYAEAYCQRARYLYEKRQYDEMREYLASDAMKYMEEFSVEERGVVYFLLANGCMELEEYHQAADYYKRAISCNVGEVSYYADCAIALAKAGNLEDASGILDEAVSIGDADDRIFLAQGEILGREGQREEAEECFRKCLQETEDNYVILRAYVMWASLYDGSTAESELLHRAEILAEGADAVSKDNRAVILELLAQTYIDLGELARNGEYDRKAVECLQEVAALGWDTYLTHNNIGILCERIGDFEAAGQEYHSMLVLYGEDYRTYKRLAFLELNIQAAKDNGDRDYERFLGYYCTAEKLFSGSGVQADSDMEMNLLRQTYEQLKEGNWL